MVGAGDFVLQSSVRPAAQAAQEWEGPVNDGTLLSILTQLMILFLISLPLDMLSGG